MAYGEQRRGVFNLSPSAWAATVLETSAPGLLACNINRSLCIERAESVAVHPVLPQATDGHVYETCGQHRNRRRGQHHTVGCQTQDEPGGKAAVSVMPPKALQRHVQVLHPRPIHVLE